MNDGDEGIDPSTIPPARNGPPPCSGEEFRIRPARNRLLQVNRTPRRKLFDRKRKEAFLEWFAATCNVSLSAGKAGVCPQTIYKHLMKDEAFAEACGRALQLGYFRLEARELQEAHRPAVGPEAEPPLPAPADAGVDPPPQRGEGYEVRVLGDELAEEHFDPQLALHLLREHRRHAPSASGGAVQRARKNQRTVAQTATNKEIAEALAKRLKGFALRTLKRPADETAE